MQGSLKPEETAIYKINLHHAFFELPFQWTMWIRIII